jgi:hypothetical protein
MSNALSASRFVYEGSPHQAAYTLLDACCSLQNLAFTIAGRQKPLLRGPGNREVPEAEALEYLHTQGRKLLRKRLQDLGQYFEEVRPRLASSLAALEPFAQVAQIGWAAGMSAHHAVLMLAARLLRPDARQVDDVLDFLLSHPPIDEVMAKLLLAKEHNALLASASPAKQPHPTIWSLGLQLYRLDDGPSYRASDPEDDVLQAFLDQPDRWQAAERLTTEELEDRCPGRVGRIHSVVRRLKKSPLSLGIDAPGKVRKGQGYGVRVRRLAPT